MAQCRAWFAVAGVVLAATAGIAVSETRGEAPARAERSSQGRSMVLSRAGIVAAESPLAAQAGALVLARGGHAVDAAVAANAAMGVVAPMSNGIGGDLFALVYDARSGRLHGLNASGWAAAQLGAQWLASRGITRMPRRGIHTVTVPGAVAGWAMLLERFGRRGFRDVLAPAIRLAEDGFPVTEWVSAVWAESEGRLGDDANAARTFLPGGRAPRAGEVFRNPDLAWSYRQIAASGADAFYRGEIGRRILARSQAQGGTLAAADLAEFQAEWVEPLATSYRGWTLSELPPNGQGIAALAMLNLMESFPLAEYGHNSARALHALIEAKKLAYADMQRYVADPRFAAVPAAWMISKGYAGTRAARIDPARARCEAAAGEAPAAGSDTVYLSVVDRDGNMVSLIQSNYESAGFGSGLVPDGTGFCLHNRGALFSLQPDSPNVLAGRKRPLHTIIPAFLSRGDVRIAFGIMGGWNQAQAHAQFVSNLADHGMNLQAALEAARFTKASFDGCDVEMESRVPAPVREELARRGHQIEVLPPFSPHVGGGQAVMRDFAAGVNTGASDPRKDGAAIPEPIAE